MYLQLEVLLGSVCGIVALLPVFLPFFFGVPAPTAEHCWIAEPFRSEDGFFGYPLESNDNFVLLFVLYVLANAVSSLGVFMSGRICVKLARAGDYRAGRYRQYLRSLLAYFVAQLIVNFAIAVSFVDNRCGYHNVDHRGTCSFFGGGPAWLLDPPRALLEHILEHADINCTDGNQYCQSYGEDCCAPYTEPKSCSRGHLLTLLDVGCAEIREEGMFACCDVGGELKTNWTFSVESQSSNAGSSYVGRVVYLLLTFLGGVLTNVMLETVLVRKARMIAQDGGGCRSFARCFMRSVDLLIVLQIILILVLGGLCVSAFMGFLCLSGADSGDQSANDRRTTATPPDPNQFLYPMGIFALAHTFVSVGICVVFVRLMRGMERREKREALSASAAPFPGAGNTTVAPVEREVPTTRSVKSGEFRRRKLVRRVAIATILSVSSTLITYGSVMSLFASGYGSSMLNFIAMLALDSIINDLCLLWVAVISETDDAANAQEAEMQSFSIGFVREPAAGSASAVVGQNQMQDSVASSAVRV